MAIGVFARMGFREASTATISAELEVSEAAMFRHFPTKRALYLAALDRSAEILIARWREIGASAAGPLAALLEIGQWYFSAIQEDSRHLRLRFRSCSETADAEIGARVREHFRELFGFVRGLFEAARSAGEIAPDTDVDAHAWLFVAIGTLLDVTQIAGLRQDLPLTTLPAIMLLAAPKPNLVDPHGVATQEGAE